MGKELFKAYDLIVLVRGEHYSMIEDGDLYRVLVEFIYEGGHIFGTSWLGWETQRSSSMKDVLPFVYLADLYLEDKVISCKPTQAGREIGAFTERFILRTSYETLSAKNDAVIFLETEDGVPLFGFKVYGKGQFYYLNSCQHSCVSSMPSPLSTSNTLRQGLQHSIRWMHQQHKRQKADLTEGRLEST